jgi:hypothetical protein
MTTTEVTTITYTQSDVYANTNAATYANMNDGSADASISNNETGTDHDGWIQADLGAPQAVNSVVVGYDFHQNLPGNFGAAAFNNATLAGSLTGSADPKDWTTLGQCDSGATTNGLQTIPVGGGTYQYLRITAAPGQWLGITEFEVWAGTAAAVAPPSMPTPPAQIGTGPSDQFIAMFDANETARQTAVANQREALIAASTLRDPTR